MQYCGTSSSADHSPSLGSSHDSASHAVTSRSNLFEIKDENAGNLQNYTEADEMRRRRQKVIFKLSMFYFEIKVLVSIVIESNSNMDINSLFFFILYLGSIFREIGNKLEYMSNLLQIHCAKIEVVYIISVTYSLLGEKCFFESARVHYFDYINDAFLCSI